MTRNVHTLLVSISMVIMSWVLLGLAPPAQAANCSTETVAGDWAFTLTGTILTPNGAVPAAAIPTATVDKQGNATNAKEARNVGGDYADETLTGNWIVNADCTGTLYINAYESGQLVRTSVISMAFDDDSSEARGVQNSLTLPDGTNVPVVITVEGRKQH